MARIGEILEVIRTTSDAGAEQTDVKIDLGGGNVVTAILYQNPGEDSHPLAGEFALCVESVGRGGWAMIAAMDPRLVATAMAGERIVASRTALGALAAKVHLKADGTTEINGADFVAMAALVDSEISKLNSDITSLKTAIGSGFTAVGLAMLANGPAGKIAFDVGAVAVPSTKSSVASTRLKTA